MAVVHGTRMWARPVVRWLNRLLRLPIASAAAGCGQACNGSARRGIGAALLLLPLRAGVAYADPSPPTAPSEAAAGALCLPAIAQAEQAERLPPLLLRSIAVVESGRADPATGRAVPWPWTINAGGTGFFYASKMEAIAAVQGFQARGIRSIDVGCAQVNLLHHPAAFPSLDAAFSPQDNVAYAARFLNSLHRTTGSWPLAAAGYHSQTASIGYGYARRVIAIWPSSERYGALPPAPGSGHAVAPRSFTADNGVYTPDFAARLRRMDEDRARTGPVWVDQPIEGAPGARHPTRPHR